MLTASYCGARDDHRECESCKFLASVLVLVISYICFPEETMFPNTFPCDICSLYVTDILETEDDGQVLLKFKRAYLSGLSNKRYLTTACLSHKVGVRAGNGT